MNADPIYRFYKEARQRNGFYGVWLRLFGNRMHLHISYERHLLDGEMRDCVSINAVTVIVGSQRRGLFKELVAELKESSPWPYLQVAQVCNPFLAAHLENTGWKRNPVFQRPYYYTTKNSSV